MSANEIFSHSLFSAVSNFESMSATLCLVGGYLSNDEGEIMEITPFVLFLEFPKANNFFDRLVSEEILQTF